MRLQKQNRLLSVLQPRNTPTKGLELAIKSPSPQTAYNLQNSLKDLLTQVHTSTVNELRQQRTELGKRSPLVQVHHHSNTQKMLKTREDRLRELDRRFNDFKQKVEKRDGKNSCMSKIGGSTQREFPISRIHRNDGGKLSVMRPALVSVPQTKQPLQLDILDKLTPQKIIAQGKASPTFGVVKQHQISKKCYTAYSAQTHKGIYRDYNEDRVSIIANILLEDENGAPSSSCSLFSLFDGHAGALCANFLKEKLHHFITSQPEFVDDKLESLRLGLLEAERRFIQLAKSGPVLDISGSCALIALFEDQYCYHANIGDSRTIISKMRGVQTTQVTIDHKPDADSETKRILLAGGGIFQNKSTSKKKVLMPDGSISVQEVERVGPYRVNPGGLSVSRAIGDIPSKDPTLGGNNGCLIPTPELGSFRVTQDMDFMVMGCDGVFDEVSNEEVVSAAWKAIERYIGRVPLKEVAKLTSERIIKTCFDNRSTDNITVIVVLFQDEEYFKKGKETCEFVY